MSLLSKARQALMIASEAFVDDTIAKGLKLEWSKDYPTVPLSLEPILLELISAEGHLEVVIGSLNEAIDLADERLVSEDLARNALAAAYEMQTDAHEDNGNTQDIGEFLTDHVPTECLNYFEHGSHLRREWWNWREGEVVDVTKSLVERAASITEDMLDVDYKPVWVAVSKQCLVWAFG
jgi:hypothetical protein